MHKELDFQKYHRSLFVYEEIFGFLSPNHFHQHWCHQDHQQEHLLLLWLLVLLSVCSLIHFRHIFWSSCSSPTVCLIKRHVYSPIKLNSLAASFRHFFTMSSNSSLLCQSSFNRRLHIVSSISAFLDNSKLLAFS